MAGRSTLSFAALRSALAAEGDPDATLDMGRAQHMGGVFWLFGAAAAAALLPFSPPVEQIGWAGWIVAAVGIAGCLVIARRRFDKSRIPDMDEIFWSGWVGLAMIVTLEWLAGGHGEPYHHLYVLPALYVAAIHDLRRVGFFVAALIAALLSPLLYQPVSGSLVLDMLAQALILLALAATSRLLFLAIRVQRGQLHRARQEAELRARRDPLTGLGNRLAFHEAVEREIGRAHRTGEPLSVVLGDLRKFKRINDRFGHVAGDECLTDAAETLRRTARTGEECFRWGGDEFAVLLPGAASDEAERAKERVRAKVGSECSAPDGSPLELLCATTALVHGQGVKEMVAEVDQSLITLKVGAGPNAPA